MSRYSGFFEVFLVAIFLFCDVTAADQYANYMVQPGDILQVSVWKEEDMQAEIAVRPDGYFSFPLVGEIVAGNLSVQEIKSTIESRLHKYIDDAVVTVVVTKPFGNKVFVIGQVNRPGEYVMNRPVDVTSATK